MFRQSSRPVFARAFSNAILGALSTRPAAALLNTPFVALVTAGPPIIRQNWVVADFTEATFGGYIAQNLPAFSVPLNLPSGLGMGVEASVTFAADNTITPPGQTVIGYYIQGGGAVIYQAEYFDVPVEFASDGDSLLLQIWIPLDNPGNAS